MREEAAEIDVTLTVNGKAYQRHVDPCRSLLDWLRDDLGQGLGKQPVSLHRGR